MVNEKYKVGRVSEYDKISAEVQARNMNAAMVNGQTGKALALLQLKVLMGVTENIPIVINDQLGNYENQLILPNIEANEAALQQNSTMRQFDLQQKLLERTLKIQHTNFMPTLGFQLTGQYQSLYNDNWRLWKYNYAPSASFTLVLSIPIFKATNWTGLKKTKLQLSALEDTRTDTRHQLHMAIDSYSKNMAASIVQVSSDHKAVLQAEKAVTISEKRYEVGRGTILELNQSQVALTQARLSYNQSIYNYLVNRADLNFTLGRENY